MGLWARDDPDFLLMIYSGTATHIPTKAMHSFESLLLVQLVEAEQTQTLGQASLSQGSHKPIGLHLPPPWPLHWFVCLRLSEVYLC